MSSESWKDVVGYEGLYEVSNLGDVRRVILTNNKNVGGLMTRRWKNGTGLIVCLCKNGKAREKAVCRMVGEAFGGDLSIQIFPEDAPLDGEEFRWVVGHEGRYAISNLGRLKTFFTAPGTYPGKVLTPCVQVKTGYVHYVLMKNGARFDVRGHALVLEAFVGPRPVGAQINHKNGVKIDNRLTNLEYATAKENTRHSIEVLGNRVDGEFNPAAKLTNDQVAEIRRLYATGMVSQQTLADDYGVTQTTISRVVRGTH